MGAHWEWLGFAGVDALVADARAAAAGQARLMARYIEKAGLKDALAARDWERFARGYNGPGYRKNAYHTKLAAAYRRHAAEGGGQLKVAAAEPPLRQGAAGDRVLMLQRKLCALGYPLAVDGIFGKATDKALRAFQRDHALAVDGIAGPLTRAAIDAALPLRGAWWRPLLDWLMRRFAI
jgi:murein L,D-transpeptidase YcbB/YkuD